MKIADILKKFQPSAESTREKGTLFERFVATFLKTSPLYKQVKEVWLWKDFPFNNGRPDTGIDLVALTDSGEYWAIQCKFYDTASRVSKPAIDSFLAASSEKFKDADGNEQTYSARLVFATRDPGSNAYGTMDRQNVSASFITTDKLDDSGIDWDIFWDEFTKAPEGSTAPIYKARTTIKEPRPHQQEAFNDVLKGFETHDRGKLIMACGTGKTFTSLRIAEAMVPEGGVMLYLVPSLSLLGQTLRAWTIDAKRTLRPILVCSDNSLNEQDARHTEYTKRRMKDDDQDINLSDLAHPATTSVKALVKRWGRVRERKDGFTVVFSTYQSIGVIRDAQKKGFPEFDLIICDEAHRTTGVALSDSDDMSAFMLVHSNENVKGKKRLYMTATPRIYGEAAKKKAGEKDGAVVICSMDDEATYGPVFHILKFGDAVKQGLLADYKVIILTVRESVAQAYKDLIDAERRELYRLAYPRMSKAPDDEIDELILSDVAKVVGCWQGLAKQSNYLNDDGAFSNDFHADPAPMRRAVAFSQTIKISREIITKLFKDVSEKIGLIQDKQAAEDPNFNEPRVKMEIDHVDGSFVGNERKQRLDWLASEPEPDSCHILTNVRCLSEGVDVPSLDAVLFLSPRNSQVDIIQSVGRVMRNAPDKKYGYIILPIAIPESVDPETILDKNERYKVVWDVLKSLRSHDERLKIEINKIRFNDDHPDSDPGPGPDPVIGEPPKKTRDDQIHLILCGEAMMKEAIRAKVVQKCGDRDYLDQSAAVIAEIAKIHVDQIRAQLQNPTPEQRRAFDEFLTRLQRDLNPSIDEEQAIEMLSQHIITQPVFDALFKDYPFAKKNVVSQAFDRLLNTFQTESSEEEWQKLEKIRKDISERVEGITTLSGKQQVITKLYDQFFRVAARKTAEKLGIVYTPVEVVDFIIHSVEHILKTEFDKSMNNRNVHILDPFTGTGTFIVRLLQSGILKTGTSNFAYKFNNELHANELVLLAYYIAAINIEEAFYKVGMRSKYQPFPGLLLTDTFQMGEKELLDEPEDWQKPFAFPKNTIGEDDVEHVENDQRIIRQRRQTIEVIFGNPPYSVGQGSANDNNQNQKYPALDGRVAETYVAQSTANLKNSLYDSYIKAFRWASDRIGPKGVIGFVTNGGWLDANAMDGFRKCLQNEFTSIYVFNLRGNQRTSGELSRKEGGKIFGSGSRAPIAITILVKNPEKAGKPCEIFYHDIGDYLKREEKLAIIKGFHDISYMPFQQITPNPQGDWINQRNEEFESYIGLGNKEKENGELTFFVPYYSSGLKTAADAWFYNFSTNELLANVCATLKFYNSQVTEYHAQRLQNSNLRVDDFIDTDPQKISWGGDRKFDLLKQKKFKFNPNCEVISTYRPFCKSRLYYDTEVVQRVYRIPKIFPTTKHKNLVICVSGIGDLHSFSCLITDFIPALGLIGANQCFPLYYYEPVGVQTDLYSTVVDGYVRHDGITDGILDKFRAYRGDGTITKEDIFYFVYGYLHDPLYRRKFAADLKKTLPRLPLVSRDEFRAYSNAGRKLAKLHLNYETRERPKEVFVRMTDKPSYRVQKMYFPRKDQKDTIIFNSTISIENIPLRAYDYVVNGKSAIEWVMERYQVTKDKASGIENDPNTYSDDPRYILNLLLSVITVSLETLKILGRAPYIHEPLDR